MDEINKPSAAEREKPERVARKPYAKPRILESGAFEHLVLACVQQPGAFLCARGPVVS